MFHSANSKALFFFLVGKSDVSLTCLVTRPLKILRNLQGKMGHAWSRGLTGISALLPNLPHIRGIFGQLVDFGHCSLSFWPQGPAAKRFKCSFVPRRTDCNRDRCQGRLTPVVKTRRPVVDQVRSSKDRKAERRNKIKRGFM